MAAIRLAFVTLISAAVLGGCASMSADECITADWRTIGFEDGARGKTADSIGRHRKACAKAGVTADQSRYEEGRQAGLRDFCQPAKGYDVGHRGDAYQGVCPSDLEDEFLRAYEEGRYLHGLEQAVRDVEQSLGRVDRNLKDTRDDLVAGEKQLIDGGGSLRRALLGDMIAANAVNNGWSGMVIYGCIRDCNEIEDLDLGVKALNIIPVKTEKRGIGDLNVAVNFAGQTINPGDWIYCDNNGIVLAKEQLKLD